ncbi:uncharacterized protein LOC121712962 isoform X2 [Alosa sapidissima]|uniref:uncharacterized protein LOC121712962 isoform X2 n=1 Tax=Alosa sapidissima TaxID=34773 RepID=UPI001C08D2DB|nr:uncharacterized protein LOC121712962 isoform X2 [Alosa sapidissima]
MAGRNYYGRHGWTQSESGHKKSRLLLQCNLPQCEENVDEVLDLLSACSDDQRPHLGAARGNAPVRSTFLVEPILRQQPLNSVTMPGNDSCLCSWKKGSSSTTDQRNRMWAKKITYSGSSIPITSSTSHVCTTRHDSLPHRKRWEKSEGDLARVAPFASLESQRVGERAFCFGRDQADGRGAKFESQRHPKQRESLSTFEDLLDSSWASAALHRTMLDLENNEQESSSSLLQQSPLRYSHRSSKPQLIFQEVDYLSQPNLSLFSVENAKSSSQSSGIMRSQTQDRIVKSAFGPRLSPQEELCLQEALSQSSHRPIVSMPERDVEPSHLPSRDTEWCEDCGLAVAEPVAAGKALVPNYLSWREKLEMKDNLDQANLKMKESWKSTQGTLEQNHGDKILHSFNGQLQLGIRGPLKEAIPSDGWRLSSKQKHLLEKTHSVTGQSSKVNPEHLSSQGLKDMLKALRSSTHLQSCRLPGSREIYDPAQEVGTDERFQALYRFRLLQQCFRRWAHLCRCLAIARQCHRRRVLSSVLHALGQAVEKRHAQTHTLQHWQKARTLAQAFQHWKACAAVRQGQRSSLSRVHDGTVEDLRRRLTQPSSPLVLRETYCTWRRHSQGQEVLRAALIHYHLALLYKHWLRWRRECVRQRQCAEREEQAGRVWHLTLQKHTFAFWTLVSIRHQQARQCWRHQLQKRAFTAWTSAHQRQQQATGQHRLCVLSAAWRVWLERLERRRSGRLTEAKESAELIRRSVLQHCLLVWWRRTTTRHNNRERSHLIARRLLQRWRLLSHQHSLLRLACSLQQLFSRRTLEVAFGRWRAATAQAEVMRIQEERVRLLQDRRRLQAALRRWRRALRITRGVTHLQKKNQQTQISKCLKAWRGLVWQGATLSLVWDLREVRRVKQSFQQWRTATELHTQHKHLLLYLLFSRQHNFLQAHEHTLLSVRHRTPEQRLNEEDCSVMVSSVLLDDRRTLDELCDRLVLQKTLHTWREQALNMHKARLHCVARGREHAGVLLRRWHQLAQEELSSGVLRFTTRLAQLAPTGTHTAPLDTARSSGYYSSGPLSVSMLEITAESGGVGSHTNQSGAELSDWSLSLSHREAHCPLQASSPHYTQPADVCVADETSASCSLHPSAHRLKEVARGALARMLQPALSNAFRQWRSVTTTSRATRRHAEFHRQTQTHTLLRRAFSTWKREMQKHETAVKHRHHTLLLRSVCVWRECVCQRRRTLALKQRAEEFRCSKLLTHSYSCWRQQCSLRPVQCNPEEEALLMRKGAWLQRSRVRRRLSWTFSLWAARVRQNRAVQAVYTHTLLSRVFVAWEVCVRSRRQRTILAQAHFERSVCVRAFRWWRSSTAQHQLACLRATHTLHTLASRCLLCWNTHTQRNRDQLALLREFEAMRTRRIKSGVLLVWIEALEKHQRAQHTHYQSIVRSYLQRWQWHAQHSVCVRAVCVWLQGMREERSLRWGLRVWRGRLRLRLRRRERVWHSVGAVALVWRERALESRAQRHREERLTLLARQCLTAWRDYTESVSVERVLVCEFEEERKMMMKSRALAVWRQMAEMRWVERHYHSRLLGGALHHWMNALIGRRRSREGALAAACVWRRKTLRSRELKERAQEFQWRRCRLATLTHCFLRWSMACTHTRISQDFHRRTVCKRVLLGWQDHTEATQRNQYKEAWLQCAREQRLLGACFTRWLEALCQAGLRHAALEQRLCQLNRRWMARSLQYWRAATRGREAHRRRSRSLLQQCFSVWRESTEELCVAEYLRVECERRTAREALNTWLLWTKDRRAQRMMVDAMWIWLDGRRVSRSFHQWLRAHQRHQEASQHHNKLLLHRAFQGWHSACEDTGARGCDTLVRQVFHTWRRTTLSQRAERVCLVRVCEARRRGVLRAALSIWREKAHRRVRLCEGVFSHWLQFVHRRRKVKQAQKQHKLIQRYWCVWRACVQERTSQTRLLQLHWACWKNRTAVSLIVSTMHNDSVQQRAWLVWRKRRIRSRVALNFSANLNRALLSKAFTEWRRLALHTK